MEFVWGGDWVKSKGLSPSSLSFFFFFKLSEGQKKGLVPQLIGKLD